MNYLESTEEGKKAHNILLMKCWSDESFKQELISNPDEALKKAGITIETESKIVVNDQSDPSVLNINIPAKPHKNEIQELELTDEELEAVAGGANECFTSWFGVCTEVSTTVIINN